MAHLVEKIVALESRAALLERTVGTAAASPAAAALPSADIKGRLSEILAAIEKDRSEAEAIRAERDALQSENEALKEQVAKLNYRCKHLVRALDENDKAAKK